MRAADALVPFGFTALEAEVYAFLLGEAPATGYRIAQGIGKPAANTYKAIQSLERKGALTVEAEGSRRATPVPAPELLARLARRQEADRRGALEALRRVSHAPAASPRPVTLVGTDAALGHARGMLAAAAGHVLLHADPGSLAALRPEIEGAAGEAAVYVLGLESGVLAGVEWIPPRSAPPAGRVLELAVDTRAGLLASAAEGGELSGCAGGGASFGAQVHRLLASQMAVAEIAKLVAEDAGRKRIARVLESLDA